MSRANEPAYPSIPHDSAGSPCDWHPGLTIREEFVKAAMQVVGPKMWQKGFESVRDGPDDMTPHDVCILIAYAAIELADAVLAAMEAKT